MISVQNRRLRLSGSKIIGVFICLVIFGACSPKVLRSGKTTKEEKPATEEAEKGKKENEEKPREEKALVFNDIALVLPFQLDKINHLPNKADVDRSALALDFYQGFKMGIDQLAAEGDNFRLNVLDSKDNTVEVQRLAASKEVEAAQLIVGPVFPTEINAFSGTAKLSNKLQISPLAARSPSSQSQLNNLVTVTPPIDIHAKAIADFMAKQLKTGDQIVILNSDDEDSRKFLEPLKSALNTLRIPFKDVSAMPDIEATLLATGKNIVVTGAVNPFFISPLLAELNRLKTEGEYTMTLVGHPNWIKLDLDPGYLTALDTYISSSFYVDEMSSSVRQFKAAYKSQFQIEPSEFAFKGYDTGIYFGRLLAKYPKDYVGKLINEKQKGVSIGFDFVKEPTAGYINNHIRLLHFEGNAYKPLL